MDRSLMDSASEQRLGYQLLLVALLLIAFGFVVGLPLIVLVGAVVSLIAAVLLAASSVGPGHHP